MSEKLELARFLSKELGCQLNCHTCVMSSADYDGDYGTIYCGTSCRDGKAGNELYLEDVGIDPGTEKECWKPDIWATADDEDLYRLVDNDDVGPVIKAFEQRVAELKARYEAEHRSRDETMSRLSGPAGAD